MITRRHLLRASAVSALAPSLIARPARAQSSVQPWPNRFVKIVVPYASGGPTDAVARIVADPLAKAWGQQVVIENKGGAGTNIGAEMVARAEPDGYTVLVGSSALAMNRALYPALNYDAIADFVPVSLLVSFAFYMCVPNSSPAKSVQEFIAYAKAEERQAHLRDRRPRHAAPYGGRTAQAHGRDRDDPRALSRLGAGVQRPHSRACRHDVRKRRGARPDQGGPDARPRDLRTPSGSPWRPIFRPSRKQACRVSMSRHGSDCSSRPGRRPDIVRKMSADTAAALADPAARQRLGQLGYEVIGSTPEQLAAHLRAEIDKWSPIIKGAGIRIE